MIKVKQVKGYEGIYSVNENGEVYSHIKKRFLKSIKLKSGYRSVNLYKNKIKKKMLVHRLVAIAFIENPKNKPQVNHLDRNRSNNKVTNLEWCTAKENTVHSFKNGRTIWNKGKKSRSISESKKGSKNPNSKKVIHIKSGKEFCSISEASKSLNIPKQTLYAQLLRNSKNALLKLL